MLSRLLSDLGFFGSQISKRGSAYQFLWPIWPVFQHRGCPSLPCLRQNGLRSLLSLLMNRPRSKVMLLRSRIAVNLADLRESKRLAVIDGQGSGSHLPHFL